jgi:hypothetical protein
MKIVARLLVLLPLLWVEGVWAVDCPDSYRLTSQAEVDALGDALGETGCTGVSGNLIIEDSSDITNLDGLASITYVGTGNDIYDEQGLMIRNNAALTNLDGLSNLTLAAGLVISNNDALTDLDGLANLAHVGVWGARIRDNDALTNLDGLASLNSVGTQLYIRNNRALTSCYTIARILGWPNDEWQEQPSIDYTLHGNAAGCSSLEEIYQEASKEWAGSENCPDALYTLTSQAEVDEFGARGCPLMRGNLTIGNKDETFRGVASDISDLSALRGLKEIKGYLLIFALTTPSLQGLHNLASVGGLGVVPIFAGGPYSLTALQNLQHIRGPLAIAGFVGPSLEGLNNAKGFTSVELLINFLEDCSAIADELKRLPPDKITIGNIGPGGCNNIREALPVAPITPTINSIDHEDGKIIITVSVSDNGGAEITGYEATCTDGTNTYTGTSTSSPVTVSGLTNGVAYTCTVTATNSVGTSSASAATAPITPEEQVGGGLPIWLLYKASQ